MYSVVEMLQVAMMQTELYIAIRHVLQEDGMVASVLNHEIRYALNFLSFFIITSFICVFSIAIFIFVINYFSCGAFRLDFGKHVFSGQTLVPHITRNSELEELCQSRRCIVLAFFQFLRTFKEFFNADGNNKYYRNNLHIHLALLNLFIRKNIYPILYNMYPILYVLNMLNIRLIDLEVMSFSTDQQLLCSISGFCSGIFLQLRIFPWYFWIGPFDVCLLF